MKTFYSLLILFLLFSCSTGRHNIIYLEHLNAKEEGDQFIDSLKTAGVDTIIGYYDGCSGCNQGREKSYYVFWDSENKWNLTKFTNYSRYNHIAGYSPPINYISSNIDSIENGSSRFLVLK